MDIFVNSIILKIALKLHQPPSSILNWCFDDITLIYSAIHFEQEELLKQEKELEKQYKNN